MSRGDFVPPRYAVTAPPLGRHNDRDTPLTRARAGGCPPAAEQVLVSSGEMNPPADFLLNFFYPQAGKTLRGEIPSPLRGEGAEHSEADEGGPSRGFESLSPFLSLSTLT